MSYYSTWLGTATFAVHNNYYPLTGAHAAIATDCEQCHAGGNYSNTPNTCNGCHNANYVAAANPNHVVLGLSTDCASCHTTAPGWSPATFAVHNTYYPLTRGPCLYSYRLRTMSCWRKLQQYAQYVQRMSQC
ncbi:MAG: hypothetical protein IPH36_10710 [Saprospiraceae bacterium]|nr:hypothetical protein [Saprospiraceae bacterium]